LSFVLVAAAAVVLYVRYVRPWQLTWGATAEEVSRSLPGDDLVARPTFNATRAITIAAPPERIWPWLVQTGLTRAGWYSYDLLDNLGRQSARAHHSRAAAPRCGRHRADEPGWQARHAGPFDRLAQ
jgi:hypothetical protein